jgi:dTDP-4-amino-4,6-dideoxygalactose transaminase
MKIPLLKPIVNEAMKNAAVKSLTEEFFVGGESVKKFEDAFSAYIGTKRAVGVSSGTNALSLTLESIGIKGKEVITTPTSFIATANVVVHAGGKPVFVDIDYETNNIDHDRIEDAITDKTAGILPVHLYGKPCEMDTINRIAKKHDLFVLEDACQAHGSEYRGKKAGSLARAGCFSFYSTKNMTVCGDGGMITTDDNGIADLISKLRNCGRKEQNIHDVVGYTARLNSMNAAMGIEQLKLLDSWNSRKSEIAKIYFEGLEGIGDLMLPKESGHEKIPYHLFVVKTGSRDRLKQHLDKNGVGCAVYYPIPIHLQPIYVKMFGYKKGDYPNAEKHTETNLAIPMFGTMKPEEAEYVVKQLKSFFKE